MPVLHGIHWIYADVAEAFLPVLFFKRFSHSFHSCRTVGRTLDVYAESFGYGWGWLYRIEYRASFGPAWIRCHGGR